LEPTPRPVGARALVVAATALLAMPLAASGHALGILPVLVALGLFALAALVGLVTALVALTQARKARRHDPLARMGRAKIATALGLTTFAILAWWLFGARGAPVIHDVTTDLTDPPAFVAILPLRNDAPNPATYGGPEIAALQLAGYPELRSQILPVPPAAAFKRALGAARAMGWEIVATDPATGRIEATATTPWFHFKDDIVIRVRPEFVGSKVDVRSVSRVGKGDLGTNARRIAAYLDELRITR
jgi:hypothetical protein